MTLGGQLATQPIMPIITQPRRPSIGRESFRQRNLGCVPQNLVFRGDSAAQIAPNLNIGKETDDALKKYDWFIVYDRKAFFHFGRNRK